MLKASWLVAFLLINSASLSTGSGQPTPTLQVGAWGDDASRNNLGVKAQIETHTYDAYPDTLDYFWIGDYLADGAFIQFGYSLQTGVTCLQGGSFQGQVKCLGTTDIIFGSDARWEWQYWPNHALSDFYYQIGPEGSAGTNATWHEYAIQPGPLGTFEFLIDGQLAAGSNFTGSRSTEPILAVAERSPASNVSYPLGPVVFKGLSHFDGASWTESDALIAIDSCGTDAACQLNPYGSTALGDDSFVAGSSVPSSADGALLWTRSYVPLAVDVHPDVRFFITSVSATQTYSGSTRVDVPKNMLAYVSLVDTTTSTPGILGLIGGVDRFEGWEGAVTSRNLTVPILMSSSQDIRAQWTTDLSIPWFLAAALVTILTVSLGLVFWRRSSQHRT